jgi:hypothetical protein
MRGNAERAAHRRAHGTPDGATFSDLSGPSVDMAQQLSRMVGWALVGADGAKRSGSVNTTSMRRSTGHFDVALAGGTTHTHSVVVPLLEGAGAWEAPYAPFFTRAGYGGASVCSVKVTDRFDVAADASFVAFLYGTTGLSGMLTEVGWAWIKGSDGTKYDGADNVTTSRAGTGLYALINTGGAVRAATATHLVAGDPAAVIPLLPIAALMGTTEVRVRLLDRFGNPIDGDILVRLLG